MADLMADQEADLTARRRGRKGEVLKEVPTGVLQAAVLPPESEAESQAGRVGAGTKCAARSVASQ